MANYTTSPLTNLADILTVLKEFPSIDTIRYGILPDLGNIIYVALWSSTEHRGYGGGCVSQENFAALQKTQEAVLSFVEHSPFTVK